MLRSSVYAPGRTRREVLVKLFFFFLTLATVVNGVWVAIRTRDWIVSDWLINYEGGFVRRGLPGECAFLLARISHISPTVWVVVFYLSFFVIFLETMRRFALSSTLNFWVLCMLVSPAVLSFQILHLEGGYRKELILLAALAVLAYKMRTRLSSPVVFSVVLAAVLGVAVLSHELALFYIPYFFAAVMVVGGFTFRKTAALFALPLIVAVTLAWVCGHHIGNAATARGICASLGYTFPMPPPSDICIGGPIGYLTKTPVEAHLETTDAVRQNRYLLYFPIFAALAVLPLFGEALSLLQKQKRREVVIILVAAIVSCAASIVLFLYALDWGRWIYIHVASLTVLLLAVDRQVHAGFQPAATALRPRSKLRTAIAGGFLAVYGLTWALPNDIIDEPIRMGYLGRIHEVMKSRHLG